MESAVRLIVNNDLIQNYFLFVLDVEVLCCFPITKERLCKVLKRAAATKKSRD